MNDKRILVDLWEGAEEGMETRESDTASMTKKLKTKEEMKLENMAHITKRFGEEILTKEVDKVINNIMGYFAYEFEDIPIGKNKMGKEEKLAHSLVGVEKIKAKMEVIDAYDSWVHNEIIFLKMAINELQRDL